MPFQKSIGRRISAICGKRYWQEDKRGRKRAHHLGEDHGTTVREDHVHDAVDLRRERQARRHLGVDRSQRAARVVRRVDRVHVQPLGRDDAHADKDDRQVHPHGQVGEHGETAQGADLRENHPDQRPDHDADAEAQVAPARLDQLAERLTVGQADEADVDLHRGRKKQSAIWFRERGRVRKTRTMS